MRRPRVKICGLKDPAAIDAALDRGAHEIGLVYFPRSPRHLAIEAMASLREHVGNRAVVTVVSVDADDATLLAIAGRVRPGVLQLHGSEPPARVAAVRRITGLAATKALSVGTAADLGAIALHRETADRLLLDAKRPAGSVLPGGNGVAFDWSLLAAVDPGVPYMLSGGLNPGNVADAVRRVGPFGLDVSSGVESAPGVKDVGLIHRFFDALDAALDAATSDTQQERRPA